MELLRVENLSKSYGKGEAKVDALKNINLSIKKGEFIAIVGPSGSGKSTMLNVLSGIDYITRGKIYFQNERLDKFDEENLLNYRKENLGFIFQSYNLISNLTVKENIELGKELSDNPLSINEILKEVGLDEHKNKYPYQLSGGQMQRVAIARALVKNPKVLFCDEPTGALDEKTGKNVLSLLQKINKKYHTTMIIVTHNPSIANMGNTVIKMNSGNIVETIKNKEIIDAKDLGWA